MGVKNAQLRAQAGDLCCNGLVRRLRAYGSRRFCVGRGVGGARAGGEGASGREVHDHSSLCNVLYWSDMYLFTYLFIHSFTHSLIYSLIHSFIQSINQCLIYPHILCFQGGKSSSINQINQATPNQQQNLSLQGMHADVGAVLYCCLIVTIN